MAKYKNVIYTVSVENGCPKQGGNGLTSQLIPINYNNFTPHIGVIPCTRLYTRFLNIWSNNPIN